MKDYCIQVDALAHDLPAGRNTTSEVSGEAKKLNDSGEKGFLHIQTSNKTPRIWGRGEKKLHYQIARKDQRGGPSPSAGEKEKND